MYILLAIVAVLLFAGAAVFTKSGLGNCDSNAGVVITTGVVFIYSLVMLCVTGSMSEIRMISGMEWLTILLSGISYALSLLFGFKAVSGGNISDVAPIFTCNIVLYSVFKHIFTGIVPSVYMIVSLALILIGTLFMTIKKSGGKKSKHWFLSAWISSAFLALSSIISILLGAPVLRNHLSNTISSFITIAFALLVIILQSKKGAFSTLHTKNVIFLILAGICVCGYWFLFNYACAISPDNSFAANIADRFAVVAAVGAGCLFLRERLSARSAAGLILITAGLVIGIF